MIETLNKLTAWIEDNHLQAEWIGDRLFKIGGESFYILPELRRDNSSVESIFTEEFHINIALEDESFCNDIEVGNLCFKFGNNFYYTPFSTIEKPQLNILKYIGSNPSETGIDYSFLGLRGQFELCNGSGSYSDWIKKSKFLGVKSLGIAEHNTLAGTLPFQQECQRAGMDFILGETITVIGKDFKTYLAKCYAMNQEGWFNLLYINKIINVDNILDGQYISEAELTEYGKGLVLVIDCECEFTSELINSYKNSFEKVFFQFDLTTYKGHEKDRGRLLAHQNYLKNHLEELEPILIQDAFYLDKEYSHVKGLLNKIGSVKFQFDSDDQWYKSLDEIFLDWAPLFKDEDGRLFEVFQEAAANTVRVSKAAHYEIETEARHLPKFTALNGEDSDDLFFRLIGEGMARIGKEQDEEYWARIEEEVRVIQLGDVVDYFLILWDIIEWCKQEDILTGVGRGSAAGCLVSYLLGITTIDPIEYGLLFERFLNEGRVQTSLPDIDVDFEGERRDDVKRYMEDRYGIDFVCSVGTYGTFKIKSAIKDIGKRFGLNAKDGNFMVSRIGNNDKELKDDNFLDLFKEAEYQASLKKFIIDKPHVIDTLRIILKQPKTASIHACATLIFPRIDQHGNPRNIYNWIPVKMMDGVLVSEWEGGQLEDAGFLKEDILGIKQLDKFRGIFDKIKANKGVSLTMEDVDLTDPNVYKLFSEGLSSDVFHFGSDGLTGYLQEVKPIGIEEMIAAISLYRPGAMDSHAHTKYVKFKFGEQEPEYDYGLKEVTKETYGLYIYQEQVMKAMQELGGMDLVTADNIRKAMGKKKMDLILKYKAQFIEGARVKGCDPIDAETIWNKLEAFARYGFNKSHATAYTYIGMVCQWLKYHYPIEFWTTAFEWASDDITSRFVSEANKLDNGISIVPPDINKSFPKFTSDPETGKIYWSIGKIKFVGEASTTAILTERDEGGEFFSLDEFIDRVDTSKVNKRVVENLILSGCFDELEGITDIKKRYDLIQHYYQLAKVKMDSRIDFPEQRKYTWFWTKRQKELSGLGDFDYERLILNSELKHLVSQYIDPIKLQTEGVVGSSVVIAGSILDIKTRKTKRGDEFCILQIESNEEPINVVMWADSWSKVKNDIMENKSGMFIGSGVVTVDNYKKCNQIQTNKDSKIKIL